MSQLERVLDNQSENADQFGDSAAIARWRERVSK